MTKSAYIILFSLFILGASSVLLISLKRKDRVGRAISNLLLASILTLLFYVLGSFTKNAGISRILFSIFFSFCTIEGYTALMFSLSYNKIDPPKKFYIIVYIIIALDIISLMLNPALNHIAAFKQENSFLWSFEHKPLFFIHLTICYLFALGFFISILVRLIKAPKLYKTKYAIVIMIVFVGIVTNMFFLKSHFAFDWTIVWYVVMGILLYLFTYVFLPSELALEMGKLFMKKMSSGVLLFDIDGICILKNPTSKQYENSKGQIEDLDSFANRLGFDTTISGKKQSLSIYSSEKRYLEVEYQSVYDKKGRFECSYVLIDDVTAKHEEVKRRMYQVTHDTLTGIYNMSGFYDKCEKVLRLHPKIDYSIITTNIKQFKILNDVLGRDIGDLILLNIANALKSLNYNDIAYGRIRSDRFAILAPSNYSVEKELDSIISSRLEELREEKKISTVILNLYGVYSIKDRDESIENMCDMANMAIASIRNDITHNIAYYNKHLKDEMIWENELIGQVPQALSNHEFVI